MFISSNISKPGAVSRLNNVREEVKFEPSKKEWEARITYTLKYRFFGYIPSV